MYPVDAIKTRMQMMRPAAAMYTGVSHAVSRISGTEGLRSLWRGMTSVVLGAGPAHAVYFGTYETVKDILGANQDNRHHPFITAVSGASATIAADALMNPFDVIKQRMQVNGAMFRSVFACAASVYRSEGLGAFYISYPTTLTMTVPFTAIQFTAYETISKMLNASRRYDPFTHVISGGAAGGIASAVTTPLDVIKTLLQTRGISENVHIRNCNSLADAARIIYRSHGLAGFTRGMGPRVLTAMPSTALSWLSYEAGKEVLNSHWLSGA